MRNLINSVIFFFFFKAIYLNKTAYFFSPLSTFIFSRHSYRIYIFILKNFIITYCSVYNISIILLLFQLAIRGESISITKIVLVFYYYYPSYPVITECFILYIIRAAQTLSSLLLKKKRIIFNS